jgi:2,4-dienoyl-CoA reductase-like NADH-dependent reductase (Old Yellow Enzyme family)
MSSLYSKAVLGPLTLQNHLVMAPMTRNRAADNIPNALMAEYCAQGASAGLIITEGTSPTPNGLGYPRIPGMYSPVQVEGWKRVTDAVHAGAAKIILQIMHCGRIAHPLNLPAGKCDLIAVGRPFLASPELVTRWKTGAALNAPDMATFYTPGPKGYTDYPALKQ